MSAWKQILTLNLFIFDFIFIVWDSKNFKKFDWFD